MVVHHSNPTVSFPPALTAILTVVFIATYLWVLKHFIDDLYKPERRVYGGDKTVWLLIMVFGSVLGILAYLLFGREN